VLNNAFPNAQFIQHYIIGWLETMRKEAVMASFEMLCQNLSAGTKSQKASIRTGGFSSQESNL
jgi:hypothetical protein